jgi:hypothetical protein
MVTTLLSRRRSSVALERMPESGSDQRTVSVNRRERTSTLTYAVARSCTNKHVGLVG